MAYPACATLLLAAFLLAASTGVAGAAAVHWCHEVGSGDTLSAIARRHRTKLSRLLSLNGLRADQVIRTGSILALPAVALLRKGRLPLSAEPLRARPGALRIENAVAARDGLSRLGDLRAVARFRRLGLLVPVPDTGPGYYVAGVARPRQVTRPWTLRFLEQLGRASRALFGTPLRVTSLTRPAAAQRRLRLVNASAAPAEGTLQSTHLTGAAVDLSTRDLSPRAHDWLRTVLGRLSGRGLVHAVEEFAQPHFHVLVRKRYVPYARRLRSPLLVGGC